MKPKLIYFVTEDWFFCSHFLARATAAREAGWDVAVIANVTQHGAMIEAAGLRLLPLRLERQSTNPFKEMGLIQQIYRYYKTEKPNLVHQIAMKPILYGSLAAKWAGIKNIVNAPVGMGFIFSSLSLKARLLRLPIKLALWLLLNPRGSNVVFENSDDLSALVAQGFVRSGDAVLIRGAGVDLDQFTLSPEPAGMPLVILTARMLWDKGIGEFVEAARLLRSRNVLARFVLVGAPDAHNPAAIDESQLHRWHKEGVVEWFGHRTDIPALLAASHIVCLPSYREGLPKSLLEALAASRPVVATDVPGCREVVKHGVNGLLVPLRNPQALAQALERLIGAAGLRQAMGRAGRTYAEKEFSNERVVSETLAVYAKYLALTRS